jgi:PleD family two-component response regulator
MAIQTIGQDSMNAKLAKVQARHPVSNIAVLVVDDEPRLLTSLERLLKVRNYQVDTAFGGKLACQKLDRNHYDLVCSI